MRRFLLQLLLLCAWCGWHDKLASAADWPQGPGPNFDLTTSTSLGPSYFSAALDQQVAWRTALPETGQSAPIVHGEKLFVTTMKPVERTAEIGSDSVVYALSTADGQILWQREIRGGYPTQLSSPFGDASSPAAVTDGDSLWVLNPTGRLVCFDLNGETRWEREVTSVARAQPVLFEGKLILHRQVYLPDDHGHFTTENADAPPEKWTQLEALDAKTGEPMWLSECGVNMGCVPLVQHLKNGTAVLVVGRGGGHGPPEKPEGVSLIRADNGRTLWTLPLPGFMSTQTYPIVDDQALVFHGSDHLWVDARSGKIAKQLSIVDNVSVRRWSPAGYSTVIESLENNKSRSITQQSNLRVGDYHYFRAYTRNYLGRINIVSGRLEYLELPLQVLREPGQQEQVLWNAEHHLGDLVPLGTEKKSKRDLTSTAFRLNSVTNSRGIQVMGDARAQANGWGHTAAPLPTAFGQRLFVPLLSGMVFVVQADAPELKEPALLATSDLGPLGQAYTRASVTTDGQKIYAHTIREVLAFEPD